MTSEPIPVTTVRAEAIAALAAAGLDDPAVDADLLIGHVLGVSRGRVQALQVTGAALSPKDAAGIRSMVERRAAREPLQHITGRAAFRALELAVGPGVFIPRPETEQVTQFAIDALRAVPAPQPIAVDLGTGSGAIALALATEVPHSLVYAVEASAEAYAWARRNFDEVAAPNARLVHGDLGESLSELDGRAAVVISNPPYVPDAALPADPEVRLYDPAAALYGGEDGLDVVHDVSVAGLRLLRPGGTLVIEHGEEQGEAIRGVLAADGWRSPSTHRDWTGRDRSTTAIR